MAGRKAATGGKLVVWIILLLLIVGLAGFGTANFGGGVQSIGRIGDTEIPVNRYARALQQRLSQVQQQTGQALSLSQAQSFGLDRAVLGEVVGLTALEDEAARIGLSVGDAQVRDEIVQIPAFQGTDGQFDREGYQFALDSNGVSVDEFEASIRQDLSRSILQGAVIGGVVTPKILTDTLYAYARETRSLAWVTLDAETLDAPVPAPDDAQLDAYYQANPADYTLPERRRLTYAWLTPEMLAPTVEVTDEDLRALYEQRIGEYVQPERRLVERLVYPDTAAAEAARDAIAAGTTTFEAEVEKRGLTLSDVDMGDVTREALGDAGDAVFAMDGPGIAGPVDTALGPALFRMNGVLAAKEVPFEQARDDLAAEYRADRARRAVDDLIGDLDDRLAGGATIEDLAAETPMEPGQMMWTSDSTEGPAADTAFAEAAAAAQTGDYPEIRELAGGGLFALRLDEVVAPTLQPLDEVRDRVVADWTAAQTRERLLAAAEEIAAQAASGTALTDQGLAERGLTVRTEQDVTRNSTPAGAPADLVTTAFAMDEGETRAFVTSDGAAVVTVRGVSQPDGSGDEAVQMKQRFAQQTAQGYAQDMMNAFTAAIETRAGVTLNQAAINAVHAQFQ